MAIMCPHCSTAYSVDPNRLGTGRQVRCARCKEVWTAKPQLELAGGALFDAAEAISPRYAELVEVSPVPLIDSPSIAAELPRSDSTSLAAFVKPPPLIDLPPSTPAPPRVQAPRAPAQRRAGLPLAATAMATMAAALLIWRTDMVRLMPQTGAFYKAIGLDVNLRGLAFRDVRMAASTGDGKRTLTIEGTIVDLKAQTVSLPPLRFVVRDAKGSPIYSWDGAADQTAIRPGERVGFRTELAEPAEAARTIDVRFINASERAAGAT
jgi:predicted Zn finger-like uncharacterized protein